MQAIYNKQGLTIRESQHSDILPVGFNMRKSDADEIWASNHMTPHDALEAGYKFSKPCYTALLNGVPIAMFGIVPISEKSATVWFLASEEADSIPVLFGQASKFSMGVFLKLYPILHNFVDERNTGSIEWLKWLGAKFDDPAPYGAEQMRFRMFIIERSSNV